MSKKKPIASVGEAKLRLVLTSIWYVVAIFCGVLGLSIFLGDKTVENWLICGIACCLPIIGVTIKNIVSVTKGGYRSGANEYSASTAGNSVYVENHPFRGAFISLIVGIVLSMAAGPILLAIYMLINIFDIVAAVRYLVANKKQNNA